MLILVPSRTEFAALFPEASLDEAAVGPVPFTQAGVAHELALVGVGLAASGARSGVLMGRSSEQEILLVGLAGSFDEQVLRPGELMLARHVELDGIGVGSGRCFVALQDAEGPLALETDSAGVLRLDSLSCAAARPAGLLSVGAASADPAEAQARRARFPDCGAEDMESWAVARAASAAGKSLTVLRGISNLVGDRQHASWRIKEALGALRELLDGWPDATLSRAGS